MKFTNNEGIIYEVEYVKPYPYQAADGLCVPPHRKNPRIVIDPTLKIRRKLNVLIEEVLHAHFFDIPEYKVRKCSANLGKLIYNQFLTKKRRRGK